jgi:hypothetical protein
MLRKRVDRACSDLRPIDMSFALGIYRLGTAKVLGEVVENGSETVILV